MQIRLTDAHLVKEEKNVHHHRLWNWCFGYTEVSADAISLRANALHNIYPPWEKHLLTYPVYKRKFAHFSRAYKNKDLLIRTLKYLFFVFLNVDEEWQFFFCNFGSEIAISRSDKVEMFGWSISYFSFHLPPCHLGQFISRIWHGHFFKPLKHRGDCHHRTTEPG